MREAAEIVHAGRIFDERGVLHGDSTDVGPDFGLYALFFREPDNIQLELAAPSS